MKIIELDQNSEEWFEYRKGKSGGSEFGKLFKVSGRGNNKIPDYAYKILAERVSKPMTPNDYLDDLPDGVPFSWAVRGHILEPKAASMFARLYGKVLSDGNVWADDHIPGSYVSPDRVIISSDGKIREAVEIKCLSTDKVLKVWANSHSDKPFDVIPGNDYQAQVIKYFMVNECLDTLYWVVYTDLMTFTNEFMAVLEIKRSDVDGMVKQARETEYNTMKYVDDMEELLNSIDN